jgi:hypothetical protein
MVHSDNAARIYIPYDGPPPLVDSSDDDEDGRTPLVDTLDDSDDSDDDADDNNGGQAPTTPTTMPPNQSGQPTTLTPWLVWPVVVHASSL